MTRLKYSLLIGIIVLATGCSKKQEEADKLKEQVLNRESTTQVDTATMATPATPDTVEMTEPDVTAVPEEQPEPEKPSMPQRPAGDGYTVQVAGCEDEAYARHLVDLYAERGYEPFVSEITVDGQLYYRVRIGLYDSFGEASSLKKELQDKYTISPWIDKVAR